MVQHNPFKGSALESPHEHIRNFLEYCNTLKHNGVPPEAIRMQLFLFHCHALQRCGFMLCHLTAETLGNMYCKLSLRDTFLLPRQLSAEIRSLGLCSMKVKACMTLGKDTKASSECAQTMVRSSGLSCKHFIRV